MTMANVHGSLLSGLSRARCGALARIVAMVVHASPLPHFSPAAPSPQVPIEDFTYLTRIHYLAPSDGLWGEHEIDYILFIKRNVDVEPNPNEVSEVKYVASLWQGSKLSEDICLCVLCSV